MSNDRGALTPENKGRWSIHEGEHSGVRIDGPNGRSVAHVIQRDPHPTLGQGITQAESEAIAKRIVDLWNASLDADVSTRRKALLANGYKTDSRCAWLAIGRCAECGRAHDGIPHGAGAADEAGDAAGE